jgi:hypothetical protein
VSTNDPPPAAEPDEEVIALATRLFGLARRGEAQALCAYVDAGVSPNLSNQSGDTLLMLAAYHGHADTVRALAERGADPDRTNDRGQTPLAGAVFEGRARGDPHARRRGRRSRRRHPRRRWPPRRCSSAPISPRS